jgi:hypothetical protein
MQDLVLPDGKRCIISLVFEIFKKSKWSRISVIRQAFIEIVIKLLKRLKQNESKTLLKKQAGYFQYKKGDDLVFTD